MAEKLVRKGGSFLIDETPTAELFTPEDFREDHKMIVATTEDFVKNEVEPHIEELEHKDFELTRRLMQQAGELGLLGADIEERYGGTQLDSIASLLITEHSARAGSFGVTLNDHVGIGSMPLVFFGNSRQKELYLAQLARGEKIGSYALTEPGSGTDALSIATTAVLSPDGRHYILNGTKQFITNGGFADIVFTYAKVDGDKFTAFLVDRNTEGVSIGAEEKKMGIRGTSTCSVFLDNAKVPVENVLFEIGRGHVVAFNILDLGRFKLAAGSVGLAKVALESCVKYAKERVQFGKPICEFGMTKHKIAEMATRTYVAESMVYRTGGLVDTVLATIDHSADDIGRQSARSIAEYAIECSINKVYGSEVLSYVADEAVQIYGGYGYIEEYPVERIYRDCRIFRIFEGTNEINRVIIVGWLMRKALKDEIPFFAAAAKLSEELSTMEPLSPDPADGPLGYQLRLVLRAKRVFLHVASAAVQKHGTGIEEQQEVLALLADIAIEIYAMESGLLRAMKAAEAAGEEQSKTKIAMAAVYVNDAMLRIGGNARQIVAALESKETLGAQMATLGRLTQFVPLDGVAMRRQIADYITEKERFSC